MKIVNIKTVMFSTALMLACTSPASRAQIYKWVDAQGRTHYSESRELAGATQTREVQAGSKAAAPQAASQGAYDWRAKDRAFRERQIKQDMQEADNRDVNEKRPKSLSGGIRGDTDLSRCNLAKDIVNGTVRRTNGLPIDQYDLDMARSDIRAYCK